MNLHDPWGSTRDGAFEGVIFEALELVAILVSFRAVVSVDGDFAVIAFTPVKFVAVVFVDLVHCLLAACAQYSTASAALE